MDASVNFLAIVVAAFAAFAFGFLVHGPLFGKTWMGLMKITPADMEAGKKEMETKMPYYMGAALLQQLVVAYVLAMALYYVYPKTVMGAIGVAFWVWLGFVATTLLNGVLWEKRTPELYAFNVAYHLGSLVIMAVILQLWQW